NNTTETSPVTPTTPAADSVKVSDSNTVATSSNPLEQLNTTTAASDSNNSVTDTANKELEESLFSYMMPVVDPNTNQYVNTSIIGQVPKMYADKVLEILNEPLVKSKFPANVKFMLGSLPGDNTD